MAKKKIDNYVFLPGVSSDANLYPAAYALLDANINFIKAEANAYISNRITADSAANLAPNAVTLLTNNKTFLKDEITAWIAAQVAAAISPFNGYTYDATKCKRDAGYLIDAIIHDIQYGGNEETLRILNYYWLSGAPQIDGDRSPEVAAYARLKTIIVDYIFTNTTYTTDQSPVTSTQQTGAAPEAGVDILVTDLLTTIGAVILNGMSAAPTLTYSSYNFAEYIYDQDKCTRDVGYVLNGYLNDLRYGGNIETRFNASRYWDGTVPQVDGDRKPEIDTHNFIKNLINNYIFTNTVDSSPEQGVVPQVTISGTPAETGAAARITALVGTLTTVITNGLLSMPARANGVSQIKIQGLVNLDDILLISNATRNEILYNFSDPLLGATVNVDTAYNSNTKYTDTDFPSFLQTTDHVTTIILKSNTSTYSSSDEIQIFVEAKEMKVRPYDFGTDAIERMRVAAPQAMLDADFEYGLQPTKWQAIGLARGYPSVYEIPGSDLSVVNVTTDASSGTSNIGSSLITVTTSGSHGYSTGQPFTIKALGNSVQGFARAEGTFLVNTAPTSTTFTYYASSKVGTSNGQVLSTTYTQVRKAGLYTGSTVGIPTFSVYSNGISSTVITSLATNSGSDQVGFTGTPPLNLSPVSGTGIASGTQVTGINGTGSNITPEVLFDAFIGDTTFDVDSTVGLVENMAVDRGDGTAVFVNDITGNTITLSGPLTVDLIGADGDLVNVAGGNITPIGSGDGLYASVAYTYSGSTGTGAVIDILRSGGVYTATFTNAGTLYLSSETFTILGTNLGGASPANDLVITIDTVGGGGEVDTYTEVGTGISAPSATFNVDRVSGAYTNIVIGANSGKDYVIGDRVVIPGTSLQGTSPTNDLTVRVTTTGTNGSITGITVVSGTSITGDGTYAGVAYTYSGTTGTGAIIDVLRSAGVYTITIQNVGNGYLATEQLTIDGAILGGVTTTNDLVITIDSIDGGGGIDTYSLSGTAISSDASFTGLSGSNDSPAGTLGSFDISRTSGTYTADVHTSGSGYKIGDRILVLGTNLNGASPANDLILRVATVNVSGIATVDVVSGTAVSTGDTVGFISTISLSAPTTLAVPDSTTLTFTAIAIVQVNFTTPHGLLPGSAITVSISSSGTNHALAAGAFIVESVPSTTIIRYTARTTGALSTSTTLIGTVYTKSDAYFVHRPFDGGVQLGTGGPQHGAQAIRQSKKYIRYQSGKGAMYTTGALFAPSYDIQSISADGESIGSYITLTTDDVDHGCQVGGVIKIVGVDTGGYNGTYTVVDIINERTLKVQAQSVLSSTVALLTAQSQMSILNWHGASVRAGCFDDQNGMFWEYDGYRLAVGRRSSTFQISGTIAINKDANSIVGTNTRFRDQLVTGDRVVIRGMTHVITSITDNTNMTVTPDFRGANNISGAKCCLIKDLIIPQSEWNLDRLDGTGPSGYEIDITKMQMIGIQYSWYGAGFIDFMLRGSDGNFVFCHRIRNSNVNTEAYMRTGNMPVRYEVINECRPGRLITAMTASQVTIPLVDATNFPIAGTVYIDNELISYTGKSGNTLTGCTRAASLTNYTAGANRTYTAGSASIHQQNTGVIVASNTISPIISHWGSAYLIDGRFDEDRGYLFSYASTGISISTTKTTAFLIRLGPSVSNAIVGDLGERELLNRAQLLLKELTITADAQSTGAAGLVIEGVLNPSNYPVNPGDVTWGGLQGLSQGGQPSFAQIAPGGSINWNSGTSQVTSTATTANTINANLVVPTGSAFDRASGTTIVYVTRTSWTSTGTEIGFACTDSKFPSGTTITNRTDSPNPVATTLSQINANITVYSGGGSINFPVGSTVIRISKASWESATNPASAVGFTERSGYFPAGTTVTAVSSLIGSGANQYYEVTFSNPSIFFLGPGYVFTISLGGTYSTTNVLYFTSASWLALPVDIPFAGIPTNDSKFIAGTTISSVTTLRTFGGQGYYRVQFSNTTASITGGSTVTFSGTLYYTLTMSRASTSAVNNTNNVQITVAPNTVATNYVYFTQASWESLVSSYSATTGTEVSDTKFAAGTRVSSVSVLKTFGGTGYYTVTFNQTSNAVIAGGSTITFKFGQPPYALPGETVFSFIANPGERSSIDLSELKELTNTTLGGRGTYPNGPDVMAINVYKVAGTAVNANLVLRWGEAQA